MKISNRAMGLQQPQPQQSGLTLHDYLEIFWRYKWFLLLLLLPSVGIAYLIGFSQPLRYFSSTVIFVEPPQVPLDLGVRLPTRSVEDRIQTFQQQVLNRASIAKIVQDYDLYKPIEIAEPTRRDFIGKAHHKLQKLLVKIGLAGNDATMPATSEARAEVPEAVINRMRRDISVRATSKDAFSIGYSGEEPNAAMRVANTLGLLFIEENMKLREKQVEGVTDFYEQELAAADNNVKNHDRVIREFRAQHRGALVEDLDANLRTLDRLQQETNAIHEAMQQAEQLQGTLRKQAKTEQAALQQLKEALAAESGSTAGAERGLVIPRVQALQQELLRLRAKFNDNYPDIVAIKQEIAEITQAVEQQLAASPSTPPGISVASKLQAEQVQAAAATLASTENRLKNSEREVVALQTRRAQIAAQVKQLEENVRAAPSNQEKLLDLIRPRDLEMNRYISLLQKGYDAKITESLEKRQQGEKFRLLEAAYLPTTPIPVNHLTTIGGGVGVGGGLGAGLVLLWSYFHQVLRKPEDISGMFGLPVLAAIPRYDVSLGKTNALVTVSDADSFVAEQYRILYTKISDWNKERGCKLFAITSAMQSEGKTVTALNLAVVMAKDFGKKTLVLEGDFRRPTIPRYLKVEMHEGLVDILSSKTDLHATFMPIANTLLPFADENLTVLPAVRRVKNSSSLLSSHRMRELFDILREQYDYILIDAPPILPLSDMNIFADVVEAILLVVRAGSTPRGAVSKAIEGLNSDKLMGIVLNDVQNEGFGSYAQYGYKYRYAYKHNDD